jgi:FtsH-binding integral membrane protein
MIAGLSTSNFTIFHVVITLVAIVAGFVVMFALLGSKRPAGWTAIFWIFTVATTVTGFMFLQEPSFRTGITPAIATGIIATVFFVVGLYALYVKKVIGSWRWIYVVTMMVSLYLNVFVLITQSFQKLKFLNPAAPMVGPPFAEPTNTQFAIVQGLTILFFLVIGFLTVRKFRPVPTLSI